MVWSHTEDGKQLHWETDDIKESIRNKKKNGRSKGKFMDAVEDDMKVVGLME